MRCFSEFGLIKGLLRLYAALLFPSGSFAGGVKLEVALGEAMENRLEHQLYRDTAFLENPFEGKYEMQPNRDVVDWQVHLRTPIPSILVNDEGTARAISRYIAEIVNMSVADITVRLRTAPFASDEVECLVSLRLPFDLKGDLATTLDNSNLTALPGISFQVLDTSFFKLTSTAGNDVTSSFGSFPELGNLVNSTERLIWDDSLMVDHNIGVADILLGQPSVNHLTASGKVKVSLAFVEDEEQKLEDTASRAIAAIVAQQVGVSSPLVVVEVSHDKNSTSAIITYTLTSPNIDLLFAHIDDANNIGAQEDFSVSLLANRAEWHYEKVGLELENAISVKDPILALVRVEGDIVFSVSDSALFIHTQGVRECVSEAIGKSIREYKPAVQFRLGEEVQQADATILRMYADKGLLDDYVRVNFEAFVVMSTTEEFNRVDIRKAIRSGMLQTLNAKLFISLTQCLKKNGIQCGKVLSGEAVGAALLHYGYVGVDFRPDTTDTNSTGNRILLAGDISIKVDSVGAMQSMVPSESSIFLESLSNTLALHGVQCHSVNYIGDEPKIESHFFYACFITREHLRERANSLSNFTLQVQERLAARFGKELKNSFDSKGVMASIVGLTFGQVVVTDQSVARTNVASGNGAASSTTEDALGELTRPASMEGEGSPNVSGMLEVIKVKGFFSADIGGFPGSHTFDRLVRLAAEDVLREYYKNVSVRVLSDHGKVWKPLVWDESKGDNDFVKAALSPFLLETSEGFRPPSTEVLGPKSQAKFVSTERLEASSGLTNALQPLPKLPGNLSPTGEEMSILRRSVELIIEIAIPVEDVTVFSTGPRYEKSFEQICGPNTGRSLEDAQRECTWAADCEFVYDVGCEGKTWKSCLVRSEDTMPKGGRLTQVCTREKIIDNPVYKLTGILASRIALAVERRLKLTLPQEEVAVRFKLRRSWNVEDHPAAHRLRRLGKMDTRLMQGRLHVFISQSELLLGEVTEPLRRAFREALTEALGVVFAVAHVRIESYSGPRGMGNTDVEVSFSFDAPAEEHSVEVKLLVNTLQMRLSPILNSTLHFYHPQWTGKVKGVYVPVIKYGVLPEMRAKETSKRDPTDLLMSEVQNKTELEVRMSVHGCFDIVLMKDVLGIAPMAPGAKNNLKGISRTALENSLFAFIRPENLTVALDYPRGARRIDAKVAEFATLCYEFFMPKGSEKQHSPEAIRSDIFNNFNSNLNLAFAIGRGVAFGHKMISNVSNEVSIQCGNVTLPSFVWRVVQQTAAPKLEAILGRVTELVVTGAFEITLSYARELEVGPLKKKLKEVVLSSFRNSFRYTRFSPQKVNITEMDIWSEKLNEGVVLKMYRFHYTFQASETEKRTLTQDALVADLRAHMRLNLQAELQQRAPEWLGRVVDMQVEPPVFYDTTFQLGQVRLVLFGNVTFRLSLAGLPDVSESLILYAFRQTIYDSLKYSFLPEYVGAVFTVSDVQGTKKTSPFGSSTVSLVDPASSFLSLKGNNSTVRTFQKMQTELVAFSYMFVLPKYKVEIDGSDIKTDLETFTPKLLRDKFLILRSDWAGVISEVVASLPEQRLIPRPASGWGIDRFEASFPSRNRLAVFGRYQLVIEGNATSVSFPSSLQHSIAKKIIQGCLDPYRPEHLDIVTLTAEKITQTVVLDMSFKFLIPQEAEKRYTPRDVKVYLEAEGQKAFEEAMHATMPHWNGRIVHVAAAVQKFRFLTQPPLGWDNTLWEGECNINEIAMDDANEVPGMFGSLPRISWDKTHIVKSLSSVDCQECSILYLARGGCTKKSRVDSVVSPTCLACKAELDATCKRAPDLSASDRTMLVIGELTAHISKVPSLPSGTFRETFFSSTRQAIAVAIKEAWVPADSVSVLNASVINSNINTSGSIKILYSFQFQRGKEHGVSRDSLGADLNMNIMKPLQLAFEGEFVGWEGRIVDVEVATPTYTWVYTNTQDDGKLQMGRRHGVFGRFTINLVNAGYLPGVDLRNAGLVSVLSKCIAKSVRKSAVAENVRIRKIGKAYLGSPLKRDKYSIEVGYTFLASGDMEIGLDVEGVAADINDFLKEDLETKLLILDPHWPGRIISVKAMLPKPIWVLKTAIPGGWYSLNVPSLVDPGEYFVHKPRQIVGKGTETVLKGKLLVKVTNDSPMLMSTAVVHSLQAAVSIAAQVMPVNVDIIQMSRESSELRIDDRGKPNKNCKLLLTYTVEVPLGNEHIFSVEFLQVGLESKFVDALSQQFSFYSMNWLHVEGVEVPTPRALRVSLEGDDVIVHAPGAAGPRGVRGPDGEAADSEVGPPGPVGPPGYRGEKGHRGRIGASGEIGDIGDRGQVGQAGRKGPPGPIGPAGGEDGDPLLAWSDGDLDLEHGVDDADEEDYPAPHTVSCMTCYERYHRKNGCANVRDGKFDEHFLMECSNCKQRVSQLCKDADDFSVYERSIHGHPGLDSFISCGAGDHAQQLETDMKGAFLRSLKSGLAYMLGGTDVKRVKIVEFYSVKAPYHLIIANSCRQWIDVVFEAGDTTNLLDDAFGKFSVNRELLLNKVNLTLGYVHFIPPYAWNTKANYTASGGPYPRSPNVNVLPKLFEEVPIPSQPLESLQPNISWSEVPTPFPTYSPTRDVEITLAEDLLLKSTANLGMLIPGVIPNPEEAIEDSILGTLTKGLVESGLDDIVAAKHKLKAAQNRGLGGVNMDESLASFAEVNEFSDDDEVPTEHSSGLQNTWKRRSLKDNMLVGGEAMVAFEQKSLGRQGHTIGVRNIENVWLHNDLSIFDSRIALLVIASFLAAFAYFVCFQKSASSDEYDDELLKLLR